MLGSCFTTICDRRAGVTGLLAILAVSVLASCQYKVDKRSHDQQAQAPEKLSPETKIDFGLVQNSVVASCRDCHAGQNSPNLVSASDFRASMSRVLKEIDAGDMPPSRAGYAPLNECQKAILHRWAELGSPEESTITLSEISACASQPPTGPGPAPIPVPLPEPPLALAALTYETALNRVLKPKCLVCHKPESTSDAADILFFPYEELTSHRSLWRKPGANSKFVHLVTRDDDERMPPVRSKVKPLTQEEVDFMVRWIDAGLPQ